MVFGAAALARGSSPSRSAPCSSAPISRFTSGFRAAHLLASTKKEISAHQLHRTLQVTYKTAWFMEHRLRDAMRDGTLAPMGGAGSVVEADVTYIGRLEGQPKRRAGFGHKNTVLTLVERGGRARSFHVDNASVATVVPIVRENIAREAELMTDEATFYKRVGAEFASHSTIAHGKDECACSESYWRRQRPPQWPMHF